MFVSRSLLAVLMEQSSLQSNGQTVIPDRLVVPSLH